MTDTEKLELYRKELINSGYQRLVTSIDNQIRDIECPDNTKHTHIMPVDSIAHDLKAVHGVLNHIQKETIRYDKHKR